MKRKIFVVVLVVLTICSILFACGTNTNESTNTTSTTVINDVSSESNDIVETENETEDSTEMTEDRPIVITNVSFDKNYEGAKTIVIEYTWTNFYDHATSYELEFIDHVYQNGLECERTWKFDDSDSEDDQASVRPGYSISFTKSYLIREENVDFEIEISEWLLSDNSWDYTIAYDSISAE